MLHRMAGEGLLSKRVKSRRRCSSQKVGLMTMSLHNDTTAAF